MSQPDAADKQETTQEEHKQPLAIEYQKPAEALEDGVTTLDVGEGNIVKLDKLGPMIINTDGTISRISNWSELSRIEQERTVRLLVKKRNIVRLQKLKEGP